MWSFPARRHHQSLVVQLWQMKCTEHSPDFHFSWNDITTSALVMHQIFPSLVILKWKPFGRFSKLWATMPWASHKLRSNGDTTVLHDQCFALGQQTLLFLLVEGLLECDCLSTDVWPSLNQLCLLNLCDPHGNVAQNLLLSPKWLLQLGINKL